MKRLPRNAKRHRQSFHGALPSITSLWFAVVFVGEEMETCVHFSEHHQRQTSLIEAFPALLSQELENRAWEDGPTNRTAYLGGEVACRVCVFILLIQGCEVSMF